MFEVFEHTADLGIRVRAATLEELFVETARGFFSLIVANQEEVRPVVEKSFAIEGSQIDYLLFDWMTELLFAFETEQLLLSEFHLELDSRGLRAKCRGELVDSARHVLEHEVKAITYHELKVEQTGGEWMAEVIVDI